MENEAKLIAKLQKMRVDLQAAGLTKTGRNDYSKYDYFELSDFLTKVNKSIRNYLIMIWSWNTIKLQKLFLAARSMD